MKPELLQDIYIHAYLRTCRGFLYIHIHVYMVVRCAFCPPAPTTTGWFYNFFVIHFTASTPQAGRGGYHGVRRGRARCGATIFVCVYKYVHLYIYICICMYGAIYIEHIVVSLSMYLSLCVLSIYPSANLIIYVSISISIFISISVSIPTYIYIYV